MSKSTTCPAVTVKRYMSTSTSGVIAELAVRGVVDIEPRIVASDNSSSLSTGVSAAVWIVS